MKDYLRNGSISRSEIVNDIKDGTLNKQDIEELALQENVKKSFIGSSYPNKVEKKQWTQQYLDKLVLVSIAENFNKDYLLYLYEVSKSVRDNAQKRKGSLKVAIIAGGIFVVVVVLIAVAIKK